MALLLRSQFREWRSRAALERVPLLNTLLFLFAYLNNLQALELRRLPEEYRGPLHGLPISVKECYFVKGCDATAGLVRYTNSPAQEDGVMIKVFTI